MRVCPEVELRLGTPRESLRLVRRGDELRLLMPKSGADHAEAMHAYAAKRVAGLAEEELCGDVLKKNSPSCGLERVRVYDARGLPAKSGTGLFASALLRRYPNLPVEEEGRLSDPRLRENFVERVFAYHRLRSLFAGGWSFGGLEALHSENRGFAWANPRSRRSAYLSQPRHGVIRSWGDRPGRRGGMRGKNVSGSLDGHWVAAKTTRRKRAGAPVQRRQAPPPVPSA